MTPPPRAAARAAHSAGPNRGRRRPEKEAARCGRRGSARGPQAATPACPQGAEPHGPRVSPPSRGPGPAQPPPRPPRRRGSGCLRTGAPRAPAGGARRLDPESPPVPAASPALRPRSEGAAGWVPRGRLPVLPPGTPAAPALEPTRTSRPQRPGPGAGPRPLGECSPAPARRALAPRRSPLRGGRARAATAQDPAVSEAAAARFSAQAAAMLSVEKLQGTRGGSGAGPRASFYPLCPARGLWGPPPPPLRPRGPLPAPGGRGR